MVKPRIEWKAPAMDPRKGSKPLSAADLCSYPERIAACVKAKGRPNG